MYYSPPIDPYFHCIESKKNKGFAGVEHFSVSIFKLQPRQEGTLSQTLNFILTTEANRSFIICDFFWTEQANEVDTDKLEDTGNGDGEQLSSWNGRWETPKPLVTASSYSFQHQLDVHHKLCIVTFKEWRETDFAIRTLECRTA